MKNFQVYSRGYYEKEWLEDIPFETLNKALDRTDDITKLSDDYSRQYRIVEIEDGLVVNIFENKDILSLKQNHENKIVETIRKIFREVSVEFGFWRYRNIGYSQINCLISLN